ncbi:MAG TPA: AAA family ATPase [Candidatus Megaira endosymbiont of Hartmannula sinica]|nr:AAA family ATPase [Candidatus Megaera endosymbiont of Hartmannula sinica]
MHGQASGSRNIHSWHVLAEFYFETNTYAYQCLEQTGIKRLDIVVAFSQIKLNRKEKKIDKLKTQINDLLIDKSVEITDYKNNKENLSNNDLLNQLNVLNDSFTQKNVDDKTNSKEKIVSNNLSHIKEVEDFIIKQPNIEKTSEDDKIVEKFCTNLNKKSIKNNIDLLIGREEETKRTIEILLRRKKNNVILVGDPGVGKTAIAENLANKITTKQVPNILKDTVIYSLNVGSVVAGTKFRGDFEERINKLINWFKKNQNAILFIDEIHTIIGAGSTTAGGLDISNMLKPSLTNGDIRCIGATTYKEYSKFFEKDGGALKRRFQKITIDEPSIEVSSNILHGIKIHYEKYHNVQYSDAAINAAVSLSKRYINDKQLPDKAIDLIDEAGARVINKSKDKPVIITQHDIEILISEITKTPIHSNEEQILGLSKLESNLKNSIFGQDKAIHDLCASIKLSVAGLVKENRPIGFYLFSGNTGVGKTELAKQLAKLVNMHLIKFDMAEFSEKNSISKLIGSAPGYVGYEKGGKLTNEVEKFPYSVLLFDEIEKAHHEIYNILLQIMDDGLIKDNNGKKINFNNIIIILTTNITNKKRSSSIGFSPSNQQEIERDLNNKDIEEFFSPELRGRLDKILHFNEINSDILLQIVEKNINILASQLADKKVSINVSEEAKKFITNNFFDSKQGARAFDHAIDEHIKQDIADEILFGKLQNGGRVKININNKQEKLTFRFTKLRNTKHIKQKISHI